MRTSISLLLVLSSFVFCYGRTSIPCIQEQENCGKQVSKALEHINSFYFTKQTAHLDSALQILKSIENCSPMYTNIIFMDEVQVYLFKNDFTSALSTLNKVPSSFFPFPTFKEVLENKIKAKEAEIKGDTINQREYYQAIVLLYQKYIEENYQAFINILSQSEVEKIDCTQEDVIITELYYYISQMKGIEKSINELASFKIKINGNSLYFHSLEEQIKRNDAKAMGIFYY